MLHAGALLLGVSRLVVQSYLSHVSQVPFLQLSNAASALCEHLPYRTRRDASPCGGGRRLCEGRVPSAKGPLLSSAAPVAGSDSCTVGAQRMFKLTVEFASQ